MFQGSSLTLFGFTINQFGSDISVFRVCDTLCRNRELRLPLGKGWRSDNLDNTVLTAPLAERQAGGCRVCHDISADGLHLRAREHASASTVEICSHHLTEGSTACVAGCACNKNAVIAEIFEILSASTTSLLGCRNNVAYYRTPDRRQ